MAQLLYIVLHISLPILLLIATGFVFQKIFKADVRSFIKLIIYVLTPAVVFVKIIGTAFTGALFLTAIGYLLLLQVSMYLCSLAFSKIRRYPKSMRHAATNALMLFNSGNYGIPLIDLTFPGNPLAAASQIFIVIVQNLTTNTLGVFWASAGGTSAKKALQSIAKMPSNYFIVLAVIVNLAHIEVPVTLMVPLDYMANGFFAMALIGLGIQLAAVPLNFGAIKNVLGISVFKLLSAPAMGFLLVLLLGVKGALAQALIIGVSTPTAVNSAMLASEFGNEPAFASQIVVATTVLSAVTLPAVIYLAGLYFA